VISVAPLPPERSVRIDRVEVTTASETGATHQQRGLGCDDAVGWSGPDGGSVLATVAIADGHSDRRCVRSDTGAALVVAAATTLPGESVGSDAITGALIAGWRRRVDLHLADNPLKAESPLTAADLGTGEAEPSADGAGNARLAYGTTAALCRITNDAITIVRVGDGDVIAVSADGQARRLAIPPRQSSDVTDSISAPDAERVAQCVEIPAGAAPVLVILATDGFDNAYPAEGSMLRAASELAAMRRETGRPIGSDVLTKWARDAADVSGDDATVAAIWIETTAGWPEADRVVTR
jgi:hypothetical protein